MIVRQKLFEITLSVPPSVARQLHKIHACIDRANRVAQRKRGINRMAAHLRQADKLHRKWVPKIQLIPWREFTRPAPAHTEPSYD